MRLPHPYACRMCGATSYRRVIDRDETGSLRPTGLYRCSGCSVAFADPKAWREGEAEAPAPLPLRKDGAGPLAPGSSSAGIVAAPAPPDFSTYGACAPRLDC